MSNDYRHWLASVSDGYLLRCAEGEGDRARLAIDGYASAETAVYFAREAARYANEIIRRRLETQDDHTRSCAHYTDGTADCSCGLWS